MIVVKVLVIFNVDLKIFEYWLFVLIFYIEVIIVYLIFYN